MLTITIAPETHTLGRADRLNAEPQCDVVEIRLDRLRKRPSLRRLIEGRNKPVMISCPRNPEGETWKRNEPERVEILREAITSGPEFIDMEVDIAAGIRRYGPAIRVVSYIHHTGPLPDLKPIYQKACEADADIVRFLAPTPTWESAWPLLHALSFPGKVPVIVGGTGLPGVTLSIMSGKLGSPYAQAALEQGMETRDGQLTAREMYEAYRVQDITAKTHLVSVMGYEPAHTRIVNALNASFAAMNLNIRCLPIESQSLERMMEVFEKLRIKAVLVDPKNREKVLRLPAQQEESARVAQQADMLLKTEKGWTAYSTIWRAALTALEAKLGGTRPNSDPLDHRNVLLIGANSTTRAAIFAAQRRDTIVSIIAGDEKRAQLLAQLFKLRHVPIANLPTTLCDVLISTERSFDQFAKTKLPTVFLRETMTVLDLDGFPEDTPFITEARSRYCHIVEPTDVCADQLTCQFRAITGHDPPQDVLRSALKVR